jgi:proteic killer suppression protein
MNIAHDDADLARLESDANFTGGWQPAVVKGFRKRMQFIRSAADERDLYAMKSLHFEKMSAARSHQRSIRINDQYRLVIELRGEGKEKAVHIIGIEDYH